MIKKTDIRWYNALAFAMALGLAFTLAFVWIDDTDVWWHLKCGELFLRDFHVPRTEIFSYTAAGAPWVDGYLPAQVMLWLAWKAGGVDGIIILNAILVTVMFAMALLMSRKDSAGFSVALAVSIPAIFLSRGTMLPRPALLTPIFALLTLWLLEDYRRRGGQALPEHSTVKDGGQTSLAHPTYRRIWWVVPISAIWANCHPAFWLGPVITGVYIIGVLFSAFRTGRGNKIVALKTLVAVLCAQLAATLINPYFHRIYYSAFALFQSPELRNMILEWKPLYGEPAVISWTKEPFALVVAAWVACAIWAWRRVRIEHVLLFIFIALSTVFGRRNLMMFGAMSIPLIAWTLDAGVGAKHASPLRMIKKERAIKAGAGLVTVVGLFLIWFTATNRFYFLQDSYHRAGIGIQRITFPDKAVDFLEREHIEGNIFHNYGVGGYLIFRLYPKYKVYIDGRIFPYSYDISRLEDEAIASSSAFKILCDKYNIGAVLLPVSIKSNWQMIQGLAQSPEWAVVSADEGGALFIRRAGNEEVVKRNEINLLKDGPTLFTPQAGRKFHLWNRAEYPAAPMFWASFYEKIGLPELAAKALKPALNYRPVRKDIEAWYAFILIKAGQLEDGVAIERRELQVNPENVIALLGLASYHVQKGENGEAEETYLRAALIEPKKFDVWVTLGDLAFNRQDYGTAANRYEKAATLKPDEGTYWEKLGMSREHFDAPAAKDAYKRALAAFWGSGADTAVVQRVQERLDKLP